MALHELRSGLIKLACKTRKPGWACFLILFSLSASGQQQPPAKATPTISARTELVLVPALVRDKSGAHIGKLKKEDFTVLENGVSQKIAVFEEVTTVTRQIRRSPRKEAEFSNFLESEAKPSGVTIILLDTVNTPFLRQAQARDDLIKFLSERPVSGEPIALLTFGAGGVKVVHDFATDPRVLVAALKKVRGKLANLEEAELIRDVIKNAEVEQAYQEELSVLERFLQTRQDEILLLQRRAAILQTLEALQVVAQAVEGIPGRKALIWVSSGFPFAVGPSMSPDVGSVGSDLAAVLPLYERTWQLLNKANIAVYPVDVRGLVNPLFVDASVGRPPPRTYGSVAMRAHGDTLHTARLFADATGGRPCYDRNDLDRCFQEAADDSSSYYLLGYYLEHKKLKPGWHRLEVKVKHAGAQVRARRGFFATEATESPAATKASDIALALGSPLDYTALPLLARWTQITGGAPKRVEFEVVVLPLPGLVDESDNNHLSLEFAAVAKTHTGDVAAQATKKVEGRLKSETLTLVKQAGIKFHDFFELPPGEYTARFVVRDNLTGRMGSVAAPLTVAP